MAAVRFTKLSLLQKIAASPYAMPITIKKGIFGSLYIFLLWLQLRLTFDKLTSFLDSYRFGDIRSNILTAILMN